MRAVRKGLIREGRAEAADPRGPIREVRVKETQLREDPAKGVNPEEANLIGSPSGESGERRAKSVERRVKSGRVRPERSDTRRQICVGQVEAADP